MTIHVSLYILILSFSKMNLNIIFPSEPSEKETECRKQENPTLKICTSIHPEDSQFKCCYVTGKGLNKCGFLENTEYGIKKFKHIYSDYDDISIECGAEHLINIIVLCFLFFCLII